MDLRLVKRKGFTLAELSIILVVIGLLTGGILAAQSMISTSKVEAEAMQLGQFDAAVENFKTKYNYLPGDAPAFGGNGDGLIEGFNPSLNYNADDTVFTGEIANFWYNLDQQQFPSVGSVAYNALPGPSENISGLNKNVPESKLGKAQSFFIASAFSNGNGNPDASHPANYYTIFDPSQAAGNTQAQGISFIRGTDSTNSPLKPVELLALDKKLDDGVGTTGNILSGSLSYPYSGANGSIINTPLSTCSDSVTGIYKSQNNSYECTPLIRIGAQTGNAL